MPSDASPAGDGLPRRALVVGRFQPPHRGHLHCLQEAARLADEVVVVVGSAQRSHDLMDPFTAGERLEMLAALAADAGLPLRWVVPVADLGQYHLWVAHVAAHVPRFDVVVGGNPLTLSLFRAAGFKTHEVREEQRSAWRGTSIRRRLLAGEKVDDAVTPAVARYLERAEARERFDVLRALVKEQSA